MNQRLPNILIERDVVPPPLIKPLGILNRTDGTKNGPHILAKKKRHKKPVSKKKGKMLPGVSLEKAVARIQQLMDPGSSVTHDEKLVDRVGIERQFDVVIRGSFGGRPMLGVVECRDHSRKKGLDAIEAFAKKTENLGANLKLMVSKKGFTENALVLAEHEHIGCLSMLPQNTKQAGLHFGEMWYGVESLWGQVRLVLHPDGEVESPDPTAINQAAWQGRPVINWFLRELFTTHRDRTKDGQIQLDVTFNEARLLEIGGKEYSIKAVSCIAEGVYRKKWKWISWTGDGMYDWHHNRLTVPAKGTVTSSSVETDISKWDDFDGEIPDKSSGILTLVHQKTQIWDDASPVPDIESL